MSMQLDPTDPLEAGTAILAAIAWPEHLPEGKEVAAAHAALMAHILRTAAEADSAWQWIKQPIKPGYLLMPPGEVRRTMERTVKRIQEALRVARIARPFLANVALPVPPPLPKGVARLSLNEVIPFVLGDADQTDPHNFEQRMFRPRRSVLHLVVALEQAIVALKADIGRPPKLEELLLTDSFLPWFVARAEQLEPVILAIDAFKVPADKLLQVRLAG